MPRGNRSILTAIAVVSAFAVGIAWITFPQFPALDKLDYGEPRNEDYRPGGRECEPANLTAIRDIKVRLDRTEDCYAKAEEYRQSSDDLVQQTRAANAAEAQAKVASQGLWTAWFQTIGGFITLAAVIAAAAYARDAAQQGRRAADEANSSRMSFIERERAHLKFVYASATSNHPGRIKFILNLVNRGTGLAEIDGVAFEWCDAPSWPDAAPPLAEGLQIKVAGDTNAEVSFEMGEPVKFPALVVGYARYRTLTLDDCRTYFCFSLQQSSNALGQSPFHCENPDLNGLPYDT